VAFTLSSSSSKLNVSPARVYGRLEKEDGTKRLREGIVSLRGRKRSGKFQNEHRERSRHYHHDFFHFLGYHHCSLHPRKQTRIPGGVASAWLPSRCGRPRHPAPVASSRSCGRSAPCAPGLLSRHASQIVPLPIQLRWREQPAKVVGGRMNRREETIVRAKIKYKRENEGTKTSK